MTPEPTYFDTIADDFEARMNPFDLRSREDWFRTQLSRLPVSGAAVLDVGTGLGHFSRIVSDLGGRPVALDLGGRLLAKVHRELPQCVQASALALPFSNGTFGIVVSSECVEHTPDPLAAVLEMVRVLRPNGTLVLSTPNRRWWWTVRVAQRLGIRRFRGVENWLDRGQVREALRASGAEVLLEEGLYLFPFQWRLLWPLLAVLNRRAQRWRAWMINQCWVARKP